MMKSAVAVACACVVAAAASPRASGAEPDVATQAHITKRMADVRAWAAHPAVVAAVKRYNEAPPPASKAMTQEKWQSLSILDPGARELSMNEAAQALRSLRTDDVAEAFLSGADGGKVALLNKCTNWNHKGKPKHDVPMTGRTWQGPIELDESSGQTVVQIAVPVLDGNKKPIGSLVVGIAMGKP